MYSFLDHVKLSSHGVWPRVLGLAACFGLASAVTGCIIVDNDHQNPNPTTQPPPPVEPMLVNVDTDVTLNSTPGDGVGIFVEYYTGGTYRIWTTCDTNFSNLVCPIDVFMSVDTSSVIKSVVNDNLEGNDQVTVDAVNGTVDLQVDTASDIDAVEINTTPGAILRLEVRIDGLAQPRFVYWSGDGVLHEGAPTSPVDFSPTKP